MNKKGYDIEGEFHKIFKDIQRFEEKILTPTQLHVLENKEKVIIKKKEEKV